MATGSYPLPRSNAPPYKAGYDSINGQFDTDSIELSKHSMDDYFRHPEARGREHDVDEGDIVFALTANAEPGFGDEKLFGIPKIRSSFNGLSHVPALNRRIDHLERDLSSRVADPDAYIQDLISAHIQILGVALTDHRYERQHVDQMAQFAVQIAGKCQIMAQDYMPVGSMVLLEPPTRSMWKEGALKRKRGTDPGKLPLVARSVHPDDPSNYALRIVHRYAYDIFPPEYDILADSTLDSRVRAEFQYASALSRFALQSMVLGANILQKYDVLTIPPASAEIAASGADQYAEMMASNRQTLTRQQRAGAPRRRNALGHVFYYNSSTGGFDGPGNLLPEEVSLVLAKGVGLLGPQDRPSGSVPSTQVGQRGEALANQLANAQALGSARETFKRMTDEFLRTMFIADRANTQGLSTRTYEFGNLDYNVASDHIGRVTSRQAQFCQGYDTTKYAGLLLQKQVNALYDVTNGLQNMYNVFRGRIFGRVLEAATKGEMADIQISKNV